MLYSHTFTRSLVAAISIASFWASPSPAQETLLPSNGFLKVTGLEGDGAFNDVKRRLAHPPVVRVVDEGNALVIGAMVTFTLPAVGPGGSFSPGVAMATVITDDRGEAHCPLFKPNMEEGRFVIRIAAAYQGKSGNLLISQSNTSAGGGGVGLEKKKNGKWIAIAVVGAAALGVGLALALRSGSSSTATAPTTLSTTGITIGAPR